ncbi:hypothetical protein Rfer_4396 (plasmid) [Rhodoferax ferrireducens T118]|uniref:peptidylprolyl isomerase n=1 Tax=Albidiferax ferrireducens (strain ATCC BAA-621 / DSM 15236 / T118) TaxID=338969 RepID=Q21Q63_ALBFT|nr:peptidylprolyl isomerase [Rhodoferax ferrireducens]ABD72082.1 hypothetical protein Rfer_4396 [Rhodoferax ferrireducens T118]
MSLKSKKTIGVLVLAAVALAAGGVAMSKVTLGGDKSVTAAPPVAASSAGTNLVALVNGEPVYEIELASMLQNMPHAVAVDSYINKVLSAQAAKTESAGLEVAARRLMAEREVLSNLYFSRIGEREVKGVSDAEIDQFYQRNLSDSMFARIGASYFLSATDEDATQFALKLREGDKEAAAKLKPFLNPAGKAIAFAPADFPYDMGKLIQTMKVGEVSGSLATRNGFFVVRVDEVVPGKRPAIKEIKEQLRSALVNQRVGEKLQQLRKGAKIELKS